VKAGATEQPIWMYYGNPRAAQPENTTLYDADQVLVMHFAEAQGPPRDATAYRYDAVTSGAQLGVPGVIGNGARLDGRSLLRVPARPGLAVTSNGGFAFATWLHLDAESPRAVLYSQSQGERHLEIGVTGAKLYAEIADGKRKSRVESSSPVAAGAWHHVAVSIGTEIALYVDGAAAGNASISGLPDIGGDVLIGGLDDPKGTGGLTGLLDEVQISKVARSAWWVRLNALGQSPETTVVAYGADESKGTAGKFAAYIAMMRNLLAQVSLDGLVVIAITGFMGLASMQVMFAKAALLRRVEREDARFLQEFPDRFRREISATGVAGNSAVEAPQSASGLYAMYRAGVQGLEAVAGARGGARASLDFGHEAFEAIRAALDGALVEATNRMNGSLVVMTVAIAGAPFLGLLGTVVGVMITFAAIAAAGDVNVNTIAPGVAAAMTATVVGLLVAIPSLFGYNWLATRISRRISAMEVFADRFVSNVALLALAAREREHVQDMGKRSPHAA